MGGGDQADKDSEHRQAFHLPDTSLGVAEGAEPGRTAPARTAMRGLYAVCPRLPLRKRWNPVNLAEVRCR